MGQYYQKGTAKHRHTKGFSVIELAVAVSVAATVAVGYLVWAKPENQNNAEKIALTRERLQVIEQALSDFFVAESRLPCPADPLMRPDNTRATGSPSTDFGREGSALSINGITCPTNIGLPPIITLGLEESYAYDAWGRQFTYHVSDAVCGNDSANADAGEANSCTAKDYRELNGDLTIRNASDSDLTTEGVFTMVSYGPDGIGGYLPGGSRVSGTNENSDNDTIYKFTLSNAGDIDLLTFKTKAQLKALTLDPLGAVVSVAACNENATTLQGVTLAYSADLDNNTTGIHHFKISTNSIVQNKGTDLVLGMLWGIQTVCIDYFTNTANSDIGWNGPTCPGGGTFDTTNDTCVCANGAWDGNCAL